MPKLFIVATGPIKLDAKVAGGETLATVETDHALLTLLVMLQQGQAKIVREDQVDGSQTVKPEESGLKPVSFAEALKAGDVSDKIIKLLADQGVTNFAKAQLYLDAQKDHSFAPIKGIGDTTDAKIQAVIAANR